VSYHHRKRPDIAFDLRQTKKASFGLAAIQCLGSGAASIVLAAKKLRPVKSIASPPVLSSAIISDIAILQ
jgi:hypothetical protein